ncbi:MAG: murein biosynthesis integral membrane protein MurJ [Phycisphaeraceae bacterium]|nr:murein biosynthesis integral membrane protein MurJ [Phycisphaeraceae bacterium]
MPPPDEPGPPPPTAPERSRTGDSAMGRAVRVFSSLTLVSRIAGLGRDIATARVFGDTAIGSAFMAAFAIPNFFRRLLGEGALTAAFIPLYTQLDRDDPDAARRFGALVVRRLTILTGIITVLVELALLAVLFLDGRDAERAFSVKLIMVMFPFMPMVCIAAILGGMLQTHGRFGPSAGMPILLNLITIAAALPYALMANPDRVGAAYVIGIAILVSGVAQVAWGVRALGPRFAFNASSDGVAETVRTMLRRFVPVVIGMGTLQINSFFDMLIAMWPNWVGPTIFGFEYPLDDRSNGILGYSQRLYQFPLGVFGVAVATAIFPMLARVTNSTGEFATTLRRGLRLSLFIGLPASAGLILVRDPLTFVVYSGGERGFSSDGVARAAAVLLGYAPAIWAFSINQVWTRAFYAAGRVRTPMNVAMCMVVVNLVLNLVLIWPFREAGLAWSTSICAIVQCVILAMLSQRLTGVNPMDRSTSVAFGRMMMMTLGMMAVVWGVGEMLPTGASWTGQLVTLIVLTAAGGGSYLALSLAMRAPELGWLLHRDRPERAPVG